LKYLSIRRRFYEETISTTNFIHAYDEKDTPFVALTLEIEGVLWTKDEKLKVGLRKKGFNHFFEPNS
jgi:predicted nucleic acid-binding protein